MATRPRRGDGDDMSSVGEHDIVRVTLRASLTVLGVGVAALLAWRLRLILLLIAVAVFIALLLQPFVKALVGRGMRRSLAVGTIYLVLVLLVASFGFVLFHPVYVSATRFASELPGFVRQAQNGTGPIGRLSAKLHLATYVSQHAPALESAITKLGKPALAVGKTVLSGLAGLVTIGFLSFFILLEAPKVADQLLSQMTSEHTAFLRRMVDRMTHQVAGFMLGDLATSIVCGVVIFVALRVTGVPFATVLAIWAGLVDFLPLVGGLLAGVPAVGVAFLHSIPAGIVTIVVFLVYQQVENHVLYPLIVARTVRLNTLFVLLAVLLGAEIGSIVGSSFGAICGALFAVPGAGVAQLTAAELLAKRQGREIGAEVED